MTPAIAAIQSRILAGNELAAERERFDQLFDRLCHVRSENRKLREELRRAAELIASQRRMLERHPPLAIARPLPVDEEGEGSD